MVARGQIKESNSIEQIDLRHLYYLLKDFAVELEIERDLLNNIITLTASSTNTDKFSILDQVHKLYDPKHKSVVEKLVEKYKEEFGSGKTKEKIISFKGTPKKKVSELVKLLKTK